MSFKQPVIIGQLIKTIKISLASATSATFHSHSARDGANRCEARGELESAEYAPKWLRGRSGQLIQQKCTGMERKPQNERLKVRRSSRNDTRVEGERSGAAIVAENLFRV